ncbi:polysaccharide pyruvyl transferase family protein [Lysobacter sp. KIS68-7]|uniref:polysaccharide pyruvyl transferase family protein n=1 Tax=Lysobacter sp. KIS68-7 TaxID=2904252 RepID=UPI001E62D9E4|nr:polysaccharide pyruvyl transferase family protein [Lysobacter sp. KIS68-7]UHQ18465.1 polysaccharide pyruvyl transferase family protein [Lysobacter sp. KIS68-7]
MTAFLSMKTQFENAGDVLINRELIRLCAEWGDVVVDVTRCPPEFLRSLDLARHAPDVRQTTSVGLFGAMLKTRLRGQPAYYFLSPGGYFGERRGLSALALVANTAVIAAMRLVGVRVCHVGVSFERLGPFHKRMLQLRARLLHRLIVRDDASAAYAQDNGIRHAGVSPDLAFGAAAYARPGERGRHIAISFRSDQTPAQGDEVMRLVQALDAVLPVDEDFRLVAQVARDCPLMDNVAQSLRGSRRRVETMYVHGDVDAALAAYHGCRAVVSNRLHALLFGVLGGCTPVAVISDSVNAKIGGLWATLGLPVLSLEGEPGLVLEALRSSETVETAKLADQQRNALQRTFGALLRPAMQGG